MYLMKALGPNGAASELSQAGRHEGKFQRSNARSPQSQRKFQSPKHEMNNHHNNIYIFVYCPETQSCISICIYALCVIEADVCSKLGE